jgi:predicted Zn-dependent protease
VRISEHLLQDQKLGEAISVARETVKLGPKIASAHMILGEALIANQQAPEGIKELEKAREVDPSVLRIHWDLLRAYTSTQRVEDAKHEKTEIEKLMQAEQAKPSQTSD